MDLESLRSTPRKELYNYTNEFLYEKNFDIMPATIWMRNYWYFCVILSIFYVTAIFLIRKFMQKRIAFEMNGALFLWNAFLAVFSIFGAIRMTPEFLYVNRRYGFQYSVCVTGYSQIPVTAFWSTLFTFSKAVELLDTFFLVLRKKPLIFLHWYHHVTVMCLTWYGYKDHTAPARWFIWMNYVVHSFMYSYYAMRSANMSCPKFVSVALTLLQILQMIVGCVVVVQVAIAKTNGQFCQQTDDHWIFSAIVYASYLALFARFFYAAYMCSQNGSRKAKGINGKEKIF